jgi:hypothetical protein
MLLTGSAGNTNRKPRHYRLSTALADCFVPWKDANAAMTDSLALVGVAAKYATMPNQAFDRR